MALKLKTVAVGDKTYAEVQDGKPIFINEESQAEVPFDVNQAAAKISSLNAEAMTHRQEKEAAQTALKPFEGLDPVKVREALTTVENLGSGELLAAGKVEEIKAAAIDATKKGYEGQIAAFREKETSLNNQVGSLTSSYHSEMLGNRFATSKFISEKMSVPAVMAQKIFGEHFKVEDGKVIAYDAKGTKLYSQAHPGEIPEFEEAVALIVNAYPYKDTVLKGRGNSGGGGGGPEGGSGGNGGNGKQILRADFAKQSPADQMKTIQSGVAVVDKFE